VYSIFKPPSKRLYLIRHGESEANAAWTHFSRSHSDLAGYDRSHEAALWHQYTEPDHVFDAPLTERGKLQAMGLREQLQRLKVADDALWVCSPLTRALQTCLLAAPPCGGRQVIIRPELTEHLASKGDVGRPKSLVHAEFPMVEGLAEVPEVWWPELDPPSCGARRILGATEQIESVRRRAGQFREWLHSRPESSIVVVGHSTWFMQFMGAKTRLKNCEVHAMQI